jgi:hypothetical protein
VIEEFERSERNKSIPLITEFRIFFKKYLLRYNGSQIPDIIINLTIESEKKDFINEYGIRIVSKESDEHKMNLIFQWLLHIIDKTFKEEDKDYEVPKKESILSCKEFEDLFGSEENHNRKRLVQNLSLFIKQYKTRLMNPFPGVTFQDQREYAEHWLPKMSAVPTKADSSLRMKLKHGDGWVMI